MDAAPDCSADAIAAVDTQYRSALDAASGDRSAEGPRAVADATIDRLSTCYQASGGDVPTQSAIVDVLAEMRDARSVDVLISALDWQPEVSEGRAIVASRALGTITLDDATRGRAIDAVAAALGRITGARGVDNRMRIELLRRLGGWGDRRATPALVAVMLARSEAQDFLINRFACEQLAALRDPGAIPALIQALYFFSPNNPAMRMNDLAAEALVRIGRPALAPLVEALAGNDADANRIAAEYIEAVRLRDEEVAATMSVSSVVAGEASYALGSLGLPEALDPLMSELSQIDQGERASSFETDPVDLAHMSAAALALVMVQTDAAGASRRRDALVSTYRRIDPDATPLGFRRSQLLVAMQHLGDPALIPFFLTEARRPRRGPDHLDDRVLAFRAAAMLGDAAAARQLETLLAHEQDPDVRDAEDEYRPLLDAALACDADLACWIERLSGDDAMVARKAAVMTARYGAGQPAAIDALVAALGHRDEEVRAEVAYALDLAAPAGSTAGVARIDELHTAEDGRAIWAHVASLYRLVQARLEARAPAP